MLSALVGGESVSVDWHKRDRYDRIVEKVRGEAVFPAALTRYVASVGIAVQVGEDVNVKTL